MCFFYYKDVISEIFNIILFFIFCEMLCFYYRFVMCKIIICEYIYVYIVVLLDFVVVLKLELYVVLFLLWDFELNILILEILDLNRL